MTAEELEPLRTGSQVEADLNISPSTRRRWDAMGKLPSVRLSNGMRRYRPSVVRRLIVESETEANPAKEVR
jgi:DNA-binding transcriptional MerR regulator